jgi:hypothetical protein
LQEYENSPEVTLFHYHFPVSGHCSYPYLSYIAETAIQWKSGVGWFAEESGGGL